ncbi:hypothetical protein NM208_g14999 [Fusarium decemcellulare]|uniref:Uncharacterized protein n=1 Tax=Fusarium decemcellulare TaxID=57161 RepID=A0ACC1RHQ0_9HYPO|nr:hypothetical protein NM208_g14999 [Fusarium decemcellulare]
MPKSLKSSGDDQEIGRVPSHAGEMLETKVTTHDAVFGEITEEGPNYRNVGRLGTAGLMMKTQIGLGVLSIPSVFDALGIIPGVILLCVIGGITTWSDYIVGIFKLRHPEVYGIDDVGRLIFGRIGREVMTVAFCLMFTFGAASAILGISVALNSLSTHAACTAIFVAVAAIFAFVFGSIQTLGRISMLAWIGVSSIVIAVFTITIAVGIQDRPAAAPSGPWKSDYELFKQPSFNEAMSALTTIIFAYCGTPAFFNIVAEMRDPQHYTQALVICQTTISLAYIVVGVVVYYFCGSYVASPALGSAGPLIKKVSYGIALPGLLVSAMLMIHLPAKFIFIRVLRGSKHLTANTSVHWMTWIGITLLTTVIAYVIASGIPIFGELIALVGALLGPLMSFIPMGCMWLFDNWSREHDGDRLFRWRAGVAWSVFVIVSGTFLTIAGTYSSISIIVESSSKSGVWSCADNSNSV